MKAKSVGVIYFASAMILALAPSLTADSGWIDILRPFYLLPAVGAGLVAVNGYLDPTIRPMRKDDREPKP